MGGKKDTISKQLTRNEAIKCGKTNGKWPSPAFMDLVNRNSSPWKILHKRPHALSGQEAGLCAQRNLGTVVGGGKRGPTCWSHHPGHVLFTLIHLHLKHLRPPNKTHWEPQASMNNSEKWSWSKMNEEMETGLVWYHLPPSTGGFGEPLSKTSYVYTNTLLYPYIIHATCPFSSQPFYKNYTNIITSNAAQCFT